MCGCGRARCCAPIIHPDAPPHTPTPARARAHTHAWQITVAYRLHGDKSRTWFELQFTGGDTVGAARAKIWERIGARDRDRLELRDDNDNINLLEDDAALLKVRVLCCAVLY